MTDRKLKEVLWHSSLLWKSFLLIPEDAYGFEHLPNNLVVLLKCNIKLVQISHSVVTFEVVDFLCNRTVDSLKTSFHLLL